MVYFVDISNNLICEFMEMGIILKDGIYYEFDVIVVVIGFVSIVLVVFVNGKRMQFLINLQDIFIGVMMQFGLKSIYGIEFQKEWIFGVKIYFGIIVFGYLNMFYIYGFQVLIFFSNGLMIVEVQS